MNLTLLSESDALQFYGELKKNHIDSLRINSEPAKRLREVRPILEQLFKDITSSELPSNSKLFDRMRHAEEKHNFPRSIKDCAHEARIICNRPAHEITKTNEPDYKLVIKSISTCINYLSSQEIPSALKSIYDEKTIYDWSKELVNHSSLSSTNTFSNPTVKMPDLTIRQKDLYNNPQPRLAVGLLLDTSGSMLTDNRIGELNEGVKLFFNSVLNDEDTKYSVELCIVTFGGEVDKVLDFANLERQIKDFNEKIPLRVNSPNDPTPMGEAVELSIKLLNERKAEYKASGVDYYQPWLVLMTDGQATDSIVNASTVTTSMEASGLLTLFSIAIGKGANLKELGKFSKKRTPLTLKGLNFKEFFEWLVESAKSTSQKAPGQKTKLAPAGWAEI